MTELKINEDNRMSDTKKEKKIEELKKQLEEKTKEVRAIEQHYWKAIGVLEDKNKEYQELIKE
jgi:uncharacterized protein (UPF0335 family)